MRDPPRPLTMEIAMNNTMKAIQIMKDNEALSLQFLRVMDELFAVGMSVEDTAEAISLNMHFKFTEEGVPLPNINWVEVVLFFRELEEKLAEELEEESG